MILFFALAFAANQSPTDIAHGRMSAIDEGREVVIRDAAAWEALWAEHTHIATLPSVDFDTEMVVGIFLGMRPSAGHDVAITGARVAGDVLIVSYIERSPAPGMMSAQMLTAPYHLVRVPRHDGDVRFEPVRR
jgi:hypothetical protein